MQKTASTRRDWMLLDTHNTAAYNFHVNTNALKMDQIDDDG